MRMTSTVKGHVRAVMLALIAALAAMFLVGTGQASAHPNGISPLDRLKHEMDSVPSAIAASYEYDTAVPSGPPPSGEGNCTFVFTNAGMAASGCFRADGDLIYVRDWIADGRSARIYWRGINGETRAGRCTNSLGANGGWGVCNKNFIENHQFTMYAAACNSSGCVTGIAVAFRS